MVYVVKDSPGLRMLGYMAHLICNVHQKRLSVFTDWPLTQWNVELMLYLLDFNVPGIRAVHRSDAGDRMDISDEDEEVDEHKKSV